MYAFAPKSARIDPLSRRPLAHGATGSRLTTVRIRPGVTVRSSRCGTDVLVVGILMLPASPRRSPARAPHRQPVGPERRRRLRGAASPASRPCGPATPSTTPLGSRGRRARHLVQQPGCITRPRRCGLHEGLDQHGVDQKNRVLSLSDHDGRSAAYRPDRTATSGDAADRPLDSRAESGNGRGNQGRPVIYKSIYMNDLQELGNSVCLDADGLSPRPCRRRRLNSFGTKSKRRPHGRIACLGDDAVGYVARPARLIHRRPEGGAGATRSGSGRADWRPHRASGLPTRQRG